ncbi:hypothetical protein [Marinithermus hydrothermalis]|uniref:hypothetical protein n=1 Tax=Marinithermus hydrothermalis TaxID=186192 RepID=UPI0002D9CB56|nr:hypothetical protein [Marinithermus hydrothermalis]
MDIAVETRRVKCTVHPDSIHTALIHTVRRLLTPNGVQQGAQASMIYSEPLQSPPETQEAPTCTDNKIVTVVFLQVAVLRAEACVVARCVRGPAAWSW